jgi:subtilisin-like proprotein convertase family protein
MFLSVLLKSFSQTAQKTCRRQRVSAIALRSEFFESRQLLSSISAFPAIPPVSLPGSGSAVTGAINPLTSIPALNSNPGAPVTVYLDFDGHTETQDWVTATSGPIVTPVFDVDNDETTFSDEELRMIEEVWYRVSEDYSPFNINVTTVNPGTFNDFESVLVSIGGDGAWAGGPGGVAFLNAFNSPVVNTCYVFTDNTGFGGVNHMKGTALAVSHEVGHQLGLLHHAVYDANGNQTAGYDGGRPDLGPIMGAPYTSERETWSNAPDSNSATSIQNDFAIITGARNGVIRHRTDDHGGDTASASSITVLSANVSASGVLERNNDRDFFQLVTDDGPVSFTVEGLNLRRIYSNNALNFGTNLDAVIRLYDAAGTLLDSSNLSTTLFGTVSATVTAGIYYVEVTHTGQYGSIGQYNLTGTVNPLETFSLTVDQASVFENAGTRAAIGTVTRSDFANLASPVIVALASSDTTELTVPASVTIQPGSRTATFFINAIDDQLADGIQRVDITGSATLGGELRTATASIQVQDYETLALTVNPSTVYENAGRGAVAVTITRSNTDTFPPNTFSVVNNQLLEHNYLGTLVRTRSIPWPTGVRPTGQNANDVVVMVDNRVAVYNGKSQAWLSVLNQSSNTWQHIAVPELSTESVVIGTGGISTSGNFVFLTDTKESATEDNGIVRVDVNTGVSTRFATRSPGYRMFIKNTDSFSDVIQEIDYLSGAVINTLPMPVTSSFSFDTGLAFDGNSLWVLAGPLGNDQIYRLNPDTGAILETHALGANRGWDGLAALNGLLYVLDDFIENQITVYDPVQRRIINTLNVGTVNNINISGGLAAITGPDRLYVTSTFGSTMYEINPTNGVVTNQWSHGLGSAEGVATANNEIYVGQFIGRDLRVFNRQGLFQRNVRLTSSGVHALGGDNVLTLVDTNLRFRDVYSGLNNKIYGLDVNGSIVGRYDAATLANEAFITLAMPVNALAVEADGTIWGAAANGILYKFSATGAIISQMQVGTASLVDIDLNITGQILITSVLGRLYQTNTVGATATSFSAGNTVAFASFGRHQTLPSGPVLVQLTNSDSTAIRLPSSVVIQNGQRSVTILADVVDDNVLDGTQTSTITASALGYIGTQSTTVTVLDSESVLVNIVAGSISENAGAAATQAQIYRTDIDGPFSYVGPRQVFAKNTAQTILDNDKINSYITVPTQTSRLTDVNVTLSLTHSFLADLDIYLVSPRGTRIELVSDLVSNEPDMISTSFDNVAPTGILTGSSPFTGRFRPEGTLEDLNGENPSGVWTLEITDDNPTDFGTLMSWGLNIETIGLAPITVNLTKTGDTDEIGVQSTVVIPANQSSVFVPVNAIDDTILDGTRISGLRATTTSAGYFSGTDNVNVLDHETLRFTVNRTTVPETAGVGTITGTLTRPNTHINSSLTVSLTSSDISEITVPATVTFDPGSSSVSFPITVVDDTSSDGTQMVTVRAVTSQYVVDRNQIISVTDVEPRLVLSSSVSSVAETAGSFIATVTRQQQTDISQPVIVSLSVSSFTGLSSPIRVPATVTIPPGRVDQTFVVTVLDDQLLDGTQTATVRAQATGATEGTATFQITDYETLSLRLSKTAVREDAGRAAARGTVTRSNLDYAFPVTVTLTSSDVSEIKVPTTITIPSGQLSASFDIEAVNDPSLDGSQTVRISASALNYVGASSTIIVDDHEPPVVTAPAPTIVDPNPVVQWNAVPLATRYEVRLQNLSAGTEQRYQVPRTSTTFRIQNPVADSLGLGRYRVLVRAYDQLERAGYWSIARDFRVVTAPTLIGPSTTSSLVSGTFPEIVWTPVLDASGYELTVHNLTTGRMNVISRRNIPTTSYRAVEVLGTGTFRATVRAFLSVASQGQAPVIDYGNFSASLDFTVLAAPSVLTPVSGGTFDRSPILSWSRITGAATYDVMVRNAQTHVIVFRDQSVPSTSIRIPQDLQNANYEVLVRAQSGRFYSNWSASRFFAVGASPGITSPLANEKAGAQPRFVWTSITGAERYEVRVLNRDTNAYVIQVGNVTGTSYTPTTRLALGEYQVTVRAISLLGEITNWSAPVNFVGGAAPVISSPTNNSATGRKPSIAWSAVDGATAYNVKIVNLASNVTVVATGNLSSTVFTPTTNLAAGRYRIWVRAVSAQGHLSNWSTAVDITVASNVIEEELTTLGTPVVAAALSVRQIKSVPSGAESTVRENSSSTKFITAVIQNVAEEANSAADVIEAETIAAATDHVMAAWDVSDWWNTTVIVNEQNNEVI